MIRPVLKRIKRSAAASLARSISERNPQAIAVAFIDADGTYHTAWSTSGSMLELIGAAGAMNLEVAWGERQQVKHKLIPRRRRKP